MPEDKIEVKTAFLVNRVHIIKIIGYRGAKEKKERQFQNKLRFYNPSFVRLEKNLMKFVEKISRYVSNAQS